MSNSNNLIVPITAQVLVVTSNNRSKMDLATPFSENSILGINQQIDTENLFDSEGSFDAGIHIHWKLPKALKHGIATDKDKIQFPQVPNRWMVVRYQTNIENLNEIPSKTWLIKSDEINDDQPNNWVVLEEFYAEDTSKHDGTTSKKQKYVFKAIGKTEIWNDNFEEKNTNSVSLTAVGAFNPYFSEVYDDSKHVLGFWDKMSNEKIGNNYTYVITGWYSDPENDPLYENSIVNPEIRAKIKKLWLNENSSIAIDRSIYTTTIHNVIWSNNNTITALNEDVNVVLGNTTTEAFSAYLAYLNKDRIGELDNAETLLNALQNHLLENEKEQPEIEKIKIENHKKQFTPKQSGFLWQIKKIEKHVNSDIDNNLPHFPNNIHVVEKLKSLNKTQEIHNKALEKLKYVQKEYYFGWYKNVLLNTVPVDNRNTIISLNNKNLETDKAEIISLKKELEVIKSKIANEIVAINTIDYIQTPLNVKENADYELIQFAQDRFWEPNDPALLLFGKGLLEVQNYIQDSNETIMCRLESDIIGKATFNGYVLHSNSFTIKELELNNIHIPSVIIKKLVSESVLLNENLALLFAQKIDATNKSKENVTIKNFAFNHIIPFQVQEINKIGSRYVQKYKETWVPQFIAWELEFQPDNGTEKIICKGFNPIANTISKNVSEQLSPQNQNLYNNVLTQSLSGFNKQLIAQIATLQLPPLEYELDENNNFISEFTINQEELAIIGTNHAYDLACLPFQNGFSPIRNGTLSFKKVALVDTFGRSQTIISDKLNTAILLSESLKEFKSKSKNSIELKNRIIQPMRLQFNWLNHKNEILTQDTDKLDHPIIGWLVPNYLDNTLLIYDALGKEIKAIRATDNGFLEEFLPSRDGIVDTASIIQNRNNDSNKELFEILKSLNVKLVMDNSKKINQKTTKANTSNTTVSLLYGQPIAIAKGELKLELQGQEIKNPTWNEYLTDNTISIQNHPINANIGNEKISDDGLIGYYLDNDYSKLVTIQDKNTMIIKPDNNATKITVLLVANCGFYIDSNAYLPTKHVVLHPHATEKLMEEINISFMLCPFMAEKDNPRIPVISSQKNSWNWIHKSNINVWHNPEEVKEQNNEETYNFKTQQFYEGWIKIDDFKQKQN